MGRGKHEESWRLIEAAHTILAEINPATVRAVCYRLFIGRMIPDMSTSSTKRVSTQLTWAREHRHIPWEWIVDETREAERVSSWSDPQSYMQAVRRSYRKDLWNGQSRLIEVWSEKGTVRGTLLPVLEEYGVTFRVMHGFASATAVHEAAEDSRAREFLVLYVGDHDPSGMYMSELTCRAESSVTAAPSTSSGSPCCRATPGLCRISTSPTNAAMPATAGTSGDTASAAGNSTR